MLKEVVIASSGKVTVLALNGVSKEQVPVETEQVPEQALVPEILTEAPLQIVLDVLEVVSVGLGITPKNLLVWVVQLFAPVACNVQVVELLGFKTATEPFNKPGSQVYVLAPLTDHVMEEPKQTVEVLGETVKTMAG